jgi:predicted transcriptional regulator
MTLQECIKRVRGRWIVEGDEKLAFHDVVVSDLMSDVLVAESEEFLLVTSLTSDQVVRTAHIVDAVALVISNGKKPQQSLVTLAREQGVPIIGSDLATFDVCRALAGCKDDNE